MVFPVLRCRSRPALALSPRSGQWHGLQDVTPTTDPVLLCDHLHNLQSLVASAFVAGEGNRPIIRSRPFALACFSLARWSDLRKGKDAVWDFCVIDRGPVSCRVFGSGNAFGRACGQHLTTGYIADRIDPAAVVSIFSLP